MEKEEDNIVSLTGYRGEMTKPIIDMDAEELQVWEREINQKIRKNLFAKNMPFVHKIDGKIVAELADGTIQIIR
jgi:hypothetical protein